MALDAAVDVVVVVVALGGVGGWRDMEILSVVFNESRIFFIHLKTPSGRSLHTVGAVIRR
jgi:hypothetical protein